MDILEQYYGSPKLKVAKVLTEEEKDSLMHYGTPRHSGRYPWGSGENPYQHSGDFLARVETLKKQGMSEAQIANAMGLSTTKLRVQVTLAKNERRDLLVDQAKSLRSDGKTLKEIADIMGFKNDSSVRALLNDDVKARKDAARATADFLREKIDEKGIIDVGAGVEKELNISREKLDQALYLLEREGYEVYGGGVPQATNPGKQTNLKVIGPPGTEHKALYDYENIHSLNDYISYDGGETFKPGFLYPESLESKRVEVRYKEDGGIDKDGVMELRPGVSDLDLGNSKYAQVRIMVDGERYLKGMAVYGDPKDFPDGVDIIFNTNKSKDVEKMDVFKKVKDDPDNPFGALIKEHGGQSFYDDPNGKYIDPITGKKQSLSLINKTREEGDWNEWSKTLPSQFLAKQNISLIKKQLGLATADKQAEFDEIMSLTNPTVRKKFLQTFADDCDSTAVHLQAASLPRQRYQVILPVPSMKDDEVFAPNFRDGEKIALVRFPHGGTFEMPILTVNNKNKDARAMLGNNPLDAIGINKKNADRLSGADFDGDTVMCIPTNDKIKITNTDPNSSPALRKLADFDNKMEYPYREGMKVMGKQQTQTEMGKISNLITDMTLKGATHEELARAVKHSMVVIDAEKHKLDYKKSEKDNGIAALKKKYQGSYDEDGRYHEGASTIISRAKSEEHVLKRKGSPHIDKDTGEVSYKQVREEYVDKKTGKTVLRTTTSTKMAETKDAYSLVSDLRNPKEVAYADYANTMKSMANTARKTMVNTGKVAYSASAKETYKEEVKTLNAKLDKSLLNAPRERQAQTIANGVLKAKKQANPNMTPGEKKKVGQQALADARRKVGASGKDTRIVINDREWQAIQAGAITETKLKQILDHADMDDVRRRAMPKATTQLSQAKIAKINAYKASGYTNAEIADALGVSTSTVSKYMNQ